MTDPTGPNFEAEQGEQVAVSVTPDDAAPPGATAVLKLGSRPSVRDDYTTVHTQPLTVGGTVSGTLDTSDLDGFRYLLQIDLLDGAGVLIQRWRGVLIVVEALP